MRPILFLVIAVFGSSGATYIATRAAVAEAPATAVVADEQAGVLRILVSGKEVARFTADGLHVREHIKFGGNITDVGIEAFANEGSSAAP